MDHFLTSLLQVVIIVDVAAAIAYFVLGGLKRSRRRRLEPVLQSVVLPAAAAPAPTPRPGLWTRLRRRSPAVEPPTASDLAQLHRILQAFHEGLA